MVEVLERNMTPGEPQEDPEVLEVRQRLKDLIQGMQSRGAVFRMLGSGLLDISGRRHDENKVVSLASYDAWFAGRHTSDEFNIQAWGSEDQIPKDLHYGLTPEGELRYMRMKKGRPIEILEEVGSRAAVMIGRRYIESLEVTAKSLPETVDTIKR